MLIYNLNSNLAQTVIHFGINNDWVSWTEHQDARTLPLWREIMSQQEIWDDIHMQKMIDIGSVACFHILLCANTVVYCWDMLCIFEINIV